MELVKPVVLGIALNEEQTADMRVLCARFGFSYCPVKPEEYAEPMEALCGIVERYGNLYDGDALPEGVLFFAGCTDEQLQKFLTLSKNGSIHRPGLLACLTETNADWNPLVLFSELYRERSEYRKKMEEIEARSGEHHHHHHDHEADGEHEDGDGEA